VLGRVRLVVKLVLIIIRAHCKRKYDFWFAQSWWFQCCWLKKPCMI
jgi:hypothetical protein